MKIFIGGMKKHHQEKFKKLHPDVRFTFACYEDGLDTWAAEARRADYVIIDQSRCSHKIVEHIRKRVRQHVYFTDSKAVMHQIINDIKRDGASRQVYTAWEGALS